MECTIELQKDTRTRAHNTQNCGATLWSLQITRVKGQARYFEMSKSTHQTVSRFFSLSLSLSLPLKITKMLLPIFVVVVQLQHSPATENKMEQKSKLQPNQKQLKKNCAGIRFGSLIWSMKHYFDFVFSFFHVNFFLVSSILFILFRFSLLPSHPIHLISKFYYLIEKSMREVFGWVSAVCGVLKYSFQIQ